MHIFRSFGIAAALLVIAFAVSPALVSVQSKPKLAVLEFKNRANNQWWYHGGAAAAQDAFVTELVKIGKFNILGREELEELMQQKHLTLSSDIDAKTAVKVGKALGVRYLLTGAVTEYGAVEKGTGARPGFSAGKKSFVAALTSRLIDTSTGEVVWADQARAEESSVKVSVGGFGGGVDDQRIFDKVMKPTIVKLVATLKAANIVK